MEHGERKPASVLRSIAKPQKNKETDIMPILLWLIGIPIPLIILIMLLHH